MIPGILISILTFPGVIVHEFAHQWFCRRYGARVYKVCYFRFGSPAGYVLHDAPRKSWHHIMIGIGPFFINSLFGVAICSPVTLLGTQLTSPLGMLLVWLGISIAMHVFPSTGDAKSIWRASWSRGTPVWLKLLSIPVVGMIYLLALGSVLWLDLIYGVVLAYVLPQLLLTGKVSVF